MIAQGAHTSSFNIVNLYRGMSKLKLKINVKVPRLLCIVGFALTVTIRYKKKTSLLYE